jgi:hypothetical protein
VLAPVPGFAVADEAQARHDVVRGVLHLLGPATPKQVAGYLDAPVADVKARWPQDAVPVDVEGRAALGAGGRPDVPGRRTCRRRPAAGPYDLYLQGT